MVKTLMKNKARITGMGSYLPCKVLSNKDLEELVDTSDEWILSRTGMKERRIAADGENPSDMGLLAAQKALTEAAILPSEIEMILVATMTPDYPCPSTAALIQSKIGAKNAAAVDLQAACTGFLYGLSVAKAYIESGMYNNILVVAAEKMSSIIDYQDRTTCVLFGDGASAALVANKGSGFFLNTISLGADGSLGECIMIPAGGAAAPATAATVADRRHFFKMEGSEVFKHAVRRMRDAAKLCLERAGLEEKNISWLVPHQANLRIMDAMAKQVDLPVDRVYKTVHKYGNTSASSVAIALEELLHSEEIHQGEHLLLVAFGGGLTWGAAVLTKHQENQ